MLPDDSWGAYTSAQRGTGTVYRCYENFSGVTDQIGAVGWWGFFLFYDPAQGWLPCDPAGASFAIEFSEYPGGPPICSYTTVPMITDTGHDYWSYGVLYRLYYFEVDNLAPCCVLSQGWVSIQSLPNEEDCAFLWMNSPQGDILAYQEQGADLVTLTTDLSVCLTSAECPTVHGACCLYWVPICYDAMSASECLAMGGRFTGETLCEDLVPPCSEITGACCHPDATCDVVTQPACPDLWLGPNTQCFTCPCVVPCPPGATLEGEPDCYDGYVDTYNNGCPGDRFLPISPGQTYCGTSGMYKENPDGSGATRRESDWYELVLTEPADVHFTVEAEFMVHYGLVYQYRWGCPGCENVLGWYPYWAVNERCTPETITYDCLAPGTYYFYVVVSNFADEREAVCGEAHYTATLTTTPCSLPPGDMCEDAFVVDALPFLASGNTCEYGDNYDAVCPYPLGTAPDVVYAYSPSVTQYVMVDLCESAYDTKLYVYEDSCPPCDSAPPIACNDDHPDCLNTMSRIERVLMQAGHTYYVIVDGYGTRCGDYTLEISTVSCPGDLDGDGDVDLTDLSMLLAHYGMTSGASYADGDLDGDGDVDLDDLTGLLSHYGEICQ
jgi:hypothetical protein